MLKRVFKVTIITDEKGMESKEDEEDNIRGSLLDAWGFPLKFDDGTWELEVELLEKSNID
jgi:hypothetical protein